MTSPELLCPKKTLLATLAHPFQLPKNIKLHWCYYNTWNKMDTWYGFHSKDVRQMLKLYNSLNWKMIFYKCTLLKHRAVKWLNWYNFSSHIEFLYPIQKGKSKQLISSKSNGYTKFQSAMIKVESFTFGKFQNVPEYASPKTMKAMLIVIKIQTLF